MIPRKVYPAVMFARKMARQGIPYGLAISKSAKYYGLSTYDVAAWMNGRQKPAPKKWFGYVVKSSSEASSGAFGMHSFGTCKASSAKEVRSIFSPKDDNTGSVYDVFYATRVYGPFETQEEARKAASMDAD